MKLLIILMTASMIAPIISCELEKGWKGIRVFETTRADVEKVLGKPTDDERGVVKYETEEAYFRYIYSGDPCSARDTLIGGCNVRSGTILQYDVQPKNQLTLADLHWDESLYEKAKALHVREAWNYYNRRDAIRLETQKIREGEVVRSIYFERAVEQSTKFTCAGK